MIYLKRISVLCILTLTVNCIPFTHAILPTNDEFQTCVSYMMNIFVYPHRISIACVKLAITDMSVFERYSEIVMNYYEKFSGQAVSDGIKEQPKFCEDAVIQKYSDDSERNIEFLKCLDELEKFGNTKDEILDSAIFLHKQVKTDNGSQSDEQENYHNEIEYYHLDEEQVETDDGSESDEQENYHKEIEYYHWDGEEANNANKAECYHLADTYGFDYLDHIQEVITLKKTATLVNPGKYCRDTYPDNPPNEH